MGYASRTRTTGGHGTCATLGRHVYHGPGAGATGLGAAVRLRASSQGRGPEASAWARWTGAGVKGQGPEDQRQGTGPVAMDRAKHQGPVGPLGPGPWPKVKARSHWPTRGWGPGAKGKRHCAKSGAKSRCHARGPTYPRDKGQEPEAGARSQEL